MAHNHNNGQTDKTPFQLLVQLLQPDKKDIYLIYTYAIFYALVNLSLPLGIQAVVTRISGGIIYDSIYILIAGIVFAILLAGFLQIMQISLVEILQRRLFARTSLNFSRVFLSYRLDQHYDDYMPERTNRFFDVINIQKGLPKLLIDLSSAMFQIFFALLLLAFYHPFFIFLSFFLVFFLYIGFRNTAPQGLATSLNESKYKYKVVYWLEEMARMPRILRTSPSSPPMNRTDKLTLEYLNYRDKHFRILVKHYWWVIGFKVMVIGGMLFLGAWLVSRRDITLGQFVASELIVITLVSAIEKIIFYLDTVYDMLTGSEKLAMITEMEIEGERTAEGKIHLPDAPINLRIRYDPALIIHREENGHGGPGRKKELVARAGSINLISASSQLTVQQMVDGILGMNASQEAVFVSANDVPIVNLNSQSWRQKLRIFTGSSDLMQGTLEGNIILRGGATHVPQILKYLKLLGIYNVSMELPDGLGNYVLPSGTNLPGEVAELFPLAIALSSEPKLLIIKDNTRFITPEKKAEVIETLSDIANKTKLNIIVFSADTAWKGQNHANVVEIGDLLVE